VFANMLDVTAMFINFTGLTVKMALR